MNNKREEIIKKAMIDKLSDGLNVYTADDILTVADIDEIELQEFYNKIQADINKLARKRE